MTYPMTQKEKRIQTCILICLDACFMELKKINPELLESISKSNSNQEMLESYSSIDGIDFYLNLRLSKQNPYANVSSLRSQQLLYEMKILRSLLTALSQLDPISFCKHVEMIWIAHTSSGANTNPMSWMIMAEADIILATAKERIYSPIDKPIRWEVFEKVFKEVISTRSNSMKSILILENLQSSHGQFYLENIILKGTKSTISSSLQKYKKWKEHIHSAVLEFNPGGSKFPRLIDALVELKEDINKDKDDETEAECIEIRENENIVNFECPDTQIHCFSYETVGNNSFGLLLDFIRPSHIILYDINLSFLRSIEMYQWRRLAVLASSNSDENEKILPPHLSVTILTQIGSAQEHKYLIQLRTEADAFTSLSKLDTIKYPVITTVFEDFTFKDCRIYIDTREFRCTLPYLLHSSDLFPICPRMVSVGDYIIERHYEDQKLQKMNSKILLFFIERKSLADLIGSLANGRL